MTIAQKTIDLILAGHSNEAVLKLLQEEFPGRGTKNTVAWYRSKINKSDKKIFQAARAARDGSSETARARETRLNAEIFGVDLEQLAKGDLVGII